MIQTCSKSFHFNVECARYPQINALRDLENVATCKKNTTVDSMANNFFATNFAIKNEAQY
jgi:hypothetical protein